MAETIASPKINVQVSGTLTNTLDDSTGGSIIHPSCSVSPTLNNGIDEAQCNRGWQRRTITIVKDAQETISLYDMVGVDIGAGAGRDGLGQPITYEEIVAIVIFNENAAAAAGSLEVLPANSEGWTPIGSHTIANGGALQGQGGLVKYQTAGIGFEINRGNEDLVVNGDFGTGDLTGWDDESAGSGEAAYQNGTCRILSNATLPADQGGVSNAAAIPLVIGKVYTLSGDITSGDNDLEVDIATEGISVTWTAGGNRISFVATANAIAAGGLTIISSGIFETSRIDNIQLREELGHRITFRAVNAAVSYSMYLLARHDEDESSSSSSSSPSTSSPSSTSSSSSSESSISASSISTSSSSISTSSSSLSTSSLSTSSSSNSSSSSQSESSSSLSSQS